VKNSFAIKYIFAFIIFFGFCENISCREIQTLYGNFDVQEPVLLDLFDCKAMQRLKEINQYGPYYYICEESLPERKYTRYDHSVGVWALLRKYGACLEEQIAGLLHDVSHTVFSHVADHMFKQQSIDEAYQDNIHAWYLKECSVNAILEKHKIILADVLPERDDFILLEQAYPDICADRLEYNLKGGLIEGLITHDDIKKIIQDLVFENNCWFFKTLEIAKKFANLSLFLTEHVWGSPASFFIYSWVAHALTCACDSGVITMDDVHFSTDRVLWDRLLSCDDQTIKDAIGYAIDYKSLFKVCDKHEDFDCHVHKKFRGIDPFVKISGQLKRLTEVDSEFKSDYNRVKACMSDGWRIKLMGQLAGKKEGFEKII